jgi:hypothetical protein
MTGLEKLLLLAAALYFLPSVIGGLRGHHNLMSLFMLNLLGGWTFVGWAGALIWSFAAAPQTTVTAVIATPEAKVAAEPTASAEDVRPRAPCPACAELILVEANKCRFCGESLRKAEAVERREPRLIADRRGL